MCGPPKPSAKSKKPDTQNYVLYDPIYMMSLENTKLYRADLWLPGVGMGAETDYNGCEELFGVMKIV